MEIQQQPRKNRLDKPKSINIMLVEDQLKVGNLEKYTLFNFVKEGNFYDT